MLKIERMDRVRAALRAQGLTQMIVCDPKSVWYLTGVAVEPYERLLALYLPTEGEPVLIFEQTVQCARAAVQGRLAHRHGQARGADRRGRGRGQAAGH